MNSINVHEQLIPGLGQRFELEVDDGHTSVDQVIVDTIAIAPAEPSIGKTAIEALRGLGRDVAVLAVIRDQTPDIVELDADLALSDGDRVAIATLRGQHHAIISVLTGAAPPAVRTQ